LYISDITYAEFVLGAVIKEGFRKTLRHINKFNLLKFHSDIGEIFRDIFTKYTLRNKLEIPNMMMAATPLQLSLESTFSSQNIFLKAISFFLRLQISFCKYSYS